MKMPFQLISPKIVSKIQLIKKGGCFEYHAVIADKIEYRYVHEANLQAAGAAADCGSHLDTMGRHLLHAVLDRYLQSACRANVPDNDCRMDVRHQRRSRNAPTAGSCLCGLIIPHIAEWLIIRIAVINYGLRDFIKS